MKIWGNDKSHRIWVSFKEDGNLQRIETRVDLSQEYPEVRRLVESLIRLAQKYEWVFVSVYRKVLMPDYDQLALELKLSDAQDFVDDPMKNIKRKLHGDQNEE